MHLQITLTKEQYNKLLQCKDLSAHILIQNLKTHELSNVIEVLCDQFIKSKSSTSCKTQATKEDTKNGIDTISAENARKIIKTKNEIKTAGSKNEVRGTAASATNCVNENLTLKTRKEILNKYSSCQYKDSKTGQSCASRFALEVDHKVPRWAGGDNHPDNLTVLCSGHNKWKYKRQAQVELL